MAIGSTVSWRPGPFGILPLYGICFFNNSLLSGSSCTFPCCMYSSLIFPISTSNPRSSQFSKEHCFLLLGEGIRNQYLCTRCPRCCLDEVAARPSQLTKQRNRCVHINSYICAFLYKCLYVSIHLDINPNMNTR